MRVMIPVDSSVAGTNAARSEFDDYNDLFNYDAGDVVNHEVTALPAIGYDYVALVDRPTTPPGYLLPNEPDEWMQIGNYNRSRCIGSSAIRATHKGFPDDGTDMTISVDFDGDVQHLILYSMRNIEEIEIERKPYGGGATVETITYDAANYGNLIHPNDLRYQINLLHDFGVEYNTVRARIEFSPQANGTAIVGQIMGGVFIDLGETLSPVRRRIIDKSIVTEDPTTGSTTFSVGGRSKQCNVKVKVDDDAVEKTAAFLETNRATPLLWDPTDGVLNSYLVLGYYRDFELEYYGYGQATFSFNIIGLVE